MCTGTPVHYEQTVRERAARPGMRVWRVCTVHRYTMSKQSENERLDQGGGCSECARVHRYTVRTPLGNERPSQGGACGEHGYTGTL